MAFEQEQDPNAAFDSALNSMRQSKDAEKNGKLSTFFNASQDIPVDKASRILNLMGKTGIDVDILASNLDEAEKLAPDTNWDDFRKSSPIMTKWLQQSPYHMKVVEDDIKSGAAQNLEQQYYRKDNTQRPLTKAEITAHGERYGKRLGKFKLAQRQAMANTVDDYGRSLYQGPEVETLPEMEKALAQQYGDDLTAENEFIAKSDKVGFLETFSKRNRENPAFLLPFIGSAVDLGKNLELFEAATAKNPNEDQQDLLIRYGRLAEAAERRGTDVLGKTAEIMSNLPAVAGEFAATGGAYRGGKAAVEKVLRTSLKRAITRGLGTAAGAAAQTLADPIAIGRDAVQRMTPGIKVTSSQEGELGVIVDPKTGDDFLPAITKAFGTNFIEKFSERTGEGPEKFMGWLKTKMFGEAVKSAPAQGVAGFLSKIKSAAGWNGVIGEMFEERVGEVMKAPIDGYHPPTFDQLVAEFLAFSVPGTPGQAIERIKALKNHGDAEARVSAFKELAAAINDSDVMKKSPEIGQKIIEHMSAEAGEVTGKKFGYIDPHEFAEYAESKGVKPEDAAVSLMGTAEVYKQAILNHNDMQVPRSRIDSVLLAGESAAYFQDKIYDGPGELSVEASKAELDRIDAKEKAQAEQVEQVKQAKAQQEESAVAVQQIKESVQKVADQIIQGMEAAGRKAEARHVSKIVADTFRILGKKQKADPLKLFQNKPLTINAPLQQGEQRLDQPAYHGSPHKFEKFDIKKIGTGEGHQAYGWGLYFAGNKKVAAYYRRMLSESDDAVDSATIHGQSIADAAIRLARDNKLNASEYGNVEYLLERIVRDMVVNKATARSAMRTLREIYSSMGGKQQKAVDVVTSLQPSAFVVEQPGRLFEVDIPEDADYLDFDKTLDKQSEKVKAALSKIDHKVVNAWRTNGTWEHATGGMLYDVLSGGNTKGNKDGPKTASKQLLSLGIPGLKYLDQASRDSEDGTSNYVLFDDKLVDVKSYEQPGQGDDARGFIEIGNARLNIQLPKGADKSTFLHEFGHFYVEILADLAAQPDATEEIQEHFSELLKWWGIKDIAEWRGMSFEQRRPYHEKFAKTWEKYLKKGEAPSKGLRKVFHQITKWLTSVYKDSPTYFDDIQITPDIRRFMDRMLATEEEIEEAQADYGRPLYDTLVKAGMAPDHAAALAKATEENAEAVSAKLRAKAMRDIEREESAAWKEEKESLKPEIAAQVDAQPIYRILSIFKTGKLPKTDAPQLVSFPDGFRFKLDKEAVKELFGDPNGEVPESIPKYVYAASGDLVHPDYAADQFQFPNGRALLEAIANAEPREQLIDRLAEEKMIERNGPPVSREEIAAEAEKAVHGIDRDKVLQLELAELAAKNVPALKAGLKGIMAKARVPNPDEVKRRAERDIAAHPVGWINPAVPRATEIKAEKAAEAAALKGDWKEAYDQKVISYINHARYVAAVEAKENVIKEIVNARKLKKSDKKLAKGMDLDAVNAARAIYAAHGIGKMEKQAAIGLAQLEAYDPEVYKSVKADIDAAIANAQDYREMKYSDFKDMQETVAGILEIAKHSKQQTVEGKKVDTETVKAELIPAFKKHSADYATEGGTKKPGLYITAKRKWLSIKALGRRVESWADAMGPAFTKYIWDPIKDAVIKYRKESIRVRRAYLDKLKENAHIFDNKPIAAPELNYTFENKAELIGALLHTGNESNLMKLLVGGRPGNKWGDVDENKKLDTSKWDAFLNRAIENGIITKADYDFCQAVWDLNDSIKVDAQKAFKERYGRFFRDITANTIQTKWGPYRGGYVPAKVDPRLVQDGAIRMSKQEEETFNNTYSHPTTYEGFTKARSAGYAKPLNLDLRQITRHFDEVLRFAHISPRTSEVSKLLQDDQINAALAAHDPEAFKEMLTPWLQRSVEQKSEKAGFNPHLDKIMRSLRKNAGTQLMAVNVVNALQNLTGLSVAGVKVKKSHLRNALFDYMQHNGDVVKQITSESEFMNQLLDKEAANIMRDIEDIILQPNGFEKFRDWAEQHGRVLQELTQNPISIMSYMAAKNQALENGKSEKDAVREAEATVRLTQGASGPEDIARFEAGTPFGKMFTQFIGYWVMKANLMGTEFSKVGKDIGLKDSAGRAFNIYVMGHMIPAVLGAVILKTMGKGWDDDDDDGYLDEVLAMFFGAQFREALALVPVLGQGANAAMNAFGSDSYGDRFLNAPAVSMIEAGLKVPGRLYKAMDSGELKKSNVKDLLSIIGLLSGVPVGAIGRPVGYLMDVDSGRADPSGPFDFTRGVITGKSGKQR